MRSSLEIFTLATSTTRVVLQTDTLIEAPNWHPDGWLLVNGDGRLYRAPLLGAPRLDPIATPSDLRCNNDHGFTRDGGVILFSAHRGNGAEIFRMPLGGSPTLISPDAPSWFHGTSPDGRAMTYPAARGGTRVVDIYAKPFDGPETRLTLGQGHCDGPDFSADGRHIFYNCDRSGHAQIWVMNADGSDQRQLFADDHVNWFPHPSPDGRHLLYLAYPPGTQGHPRDLPVALCLCAPDGTNRRRLLEFNGGQGSLNVPCWAPDGSAFAFMRFAPPQST